MENPIKNRNKITDQNLKGICEICYRYLINFIGF